MRRIILLSGYVITCSWKGAKPIWKLGRAVGVTTQSLALSTILLISSLLSFAAPGGGGLGAIRLVKANTGWAITGTGILWTSDGGQNWKDITPHKAADENLASAFFLDETHGWILLEHGEDIVGADLGSDAQFRLASTANGGTNWSIAALAIPHNIPGRGLSMNARISFADPLHGWIMGQENGNTAVSFGILMATQDGGNSWQNLAAPPVAGSLYFVSATKGWLQGGPEDALYLTNDGGNTWRQVLVAAPPQISAPVNATYGLPVLQNATSGLLHVFWMQNLQEVHAFYKSIDGGITWTLTAQLPKQAAGTDVVVVAGSKWIVGASSQQNLTVEPVAPGSGSSVNSTPASLRSFDASNIVGSGVAIDELDFASADQGWVMVWGKLLSTVDGGITWTEITPAVARAQPPRPASPAKPIPVGPPVINHKRKEP
jgi:photosystem II stability/assembly factor-like uncharacterized protein